jgi:hypothetical protein
MADSVAKSISDTATNVGANFDSENAHLKQGRQLFNAITLNTPEMTAEREQFAKEDLRKTAVRDALSNLNLLPWDTQQEERQILVEECHDAILSLSKSDATFLGHDYNPNHIASQAQAQDDPTMSTTNDNEHVSDSSAAHGHGSNMIGESQSTYLALCRAIATSKGTKSTSSGSGIPPLLEHFDLDAHVGLVHQMLQEDERLVHQHAKFSGTLVSELDFWKNYFYSIALTRLEVGLSLDEIWGHSLPTTDEEMVAAIAAANQKSHTQHQQSSQAQQSQRSQTASAFSHASQKLLQNIVGYGGGGGDKANQGEGGAQQQVHYDHDDEHEEQDNNNHEEEITFENHHANGSTKESSSSAASSRAASPPIAPSAAGMGTPAPASGRSGFSLPPLLSATKATPAPPAQADGGTNTPNKAGSNSSLNTPTGADYEMVQNPNHNIMMMDADGGSTQGISDADADADLDAEIARELEGL